MLLFNEQNQPLPDTELEFHDGWINPAKFKKMMDAGPIPLGDRGRDAFKIINKWGGAYNEDNMMDDFWMDWKRHGDNFDARLSLLRSFEVNRQYWWLRVPGSDGQILYNISLYQWSKQNLAPETWRVWIKWLDEQQRDKNISTLSDFDF